MTTKDKFVFGALIAGFLQGVSLSLFGAFEDSLVYFGFYENITEVGTINAIQDYYNLTHKFEPVIHIIFAIENTLSFGLLTESTFLILNMTLINVLIATSTLKIFDFDNKNTFFAIIIGFIIMSSYNVFSKELYAWRSIIGLSFFLFSIAGSRWERPIWIVLSILTHSTMLIFIFIFIFLESTLRIKQQKLIYASVIIFTIIIFFNFKQLSEYFSFFVSGNDISVFFESKENHAMKMWLSILFSLFILALVYKEYILNTRLRSIYIFCLLLTIFSLLSYENYHLMSRLFLPASILTTFLPFMVINNSLRYKLAKLCVALSIIPTIRLLFILVTSSEL